MKHYDEKDPLEEKQSDQQKEENNKEQPLKEDTESKTAQPVQENPDPPPAEPTMDDVIAVRSGPEDTEPEVTDPEVTVPGDTNSGEPNSQETDSQETDSQETGSPVSRIQIRLIDDLEERMRNDSYDALERDDQEDQDDQDDREDQEEKEDEEARVNYTLLSKEDLVKLLREKLDNPGKFNLRREVQEIRDAFYFQYHASMEEKKEKFLEEGGNLEDFKPADDPAESELKELLKKYRSLKAEHTKQLERTKQENLQKKQEILEAMRMLMEGQESFESTFRKFKNLQKKWFSIGIVPQQHLKDLWDSYNYFLDKFNDYVNINRELRALDLKKNLELKIQLCEKTEALDSEPNVIHAFKTLQRYHARWREIGPVPRENREEIWERFKKASTHINRKHQEYHSKYRESLMENLERKKALCEQTEAIAEKTYSSHGEWIERTNQILEIQKSWKAIGYAPKKDNNVIYARFRRACDEFFDKKGKFYAAALEDQKENLKRKLEIVEKAEVLSDSDAWKETTNELIRLQRQWKEIGKVPRKDADKLWRRFRAACDKFFSRKSNYFEHIDSTFDDNLKAKEQLIGEMDAYVPLSDHEKNLEALEQFQTRFNEIGYVPSNKKDSIRDQFRMALDRFMKKVGMDESERSLFKFRNRIRGMLNSPRSETKLNYERDKLVNKLQQLRNDIGVWENNIGFIKQSESSEDTIQGYNDRIESAHMRIRILETKIRILDDLENEN
ncbi:MAG TPA: DUF349 domain-containing protein [Bacteroides sp.]|nr:DUF349 domain-containing protein [Bacteroides sp.]